MKVERTEGQQRFVPYSVRIFIDDAQDESLLHGLLNKLEHEVKTGGIYAGIITQIRNALR